MTDSTANGTEPTPYSTLNDVFATRNIDEHATHVIPFIKPDSSILDVGCGIGSIAREFARRAHKGHVNGIDRNPKAIEQTTAEAKAAGLTNTKFEIGDVHDLSRYASDSFDIVHAHQVILHVSEPVDVLKEMRRVAKPGGIVAIRDNCDLRQLPESKSFREVKNLYEQMSRGRGGDPRAGLVNHVWMHEAGFPWDHIESGAAGWSYTSPEGRSLWGGSGMLGIRETILKLGLGSEELFDQHEKDWNEWTKKNDAKLFGLDGWVIGRK